MSITALDRVRIANERLERNRWQPRRDTDDTGRPTPSQLKSGQWEAPHRDQKTNRVAYRKLHPFEALHQSGKLGDGCKLAADKLLTHFIGSTGVNVGDGTGLNPSDMVEFPHIYHGQILAQMRKVVSHPRTWDALISICDETGNIEEIGRSWTGAKQRGQAYAAGLALIRSGLERLMYHYGLDTSYHARASP